MKAQILTEDFYTNDLPYVLLRGWNDLNDGSPDRWIFDEDNWHEIREIIINNFIEELDELFERRKSFDND